jgi:hypothetical protein
MGLNPYWEAKFSATPHEIPSILWNQKVYWQSRKSTTNVPILRHMQQARSLSQDLLYHHLPISVYIFTAVLSSVLRYLTFVSIHHPSHPCYKPHQSCLRDLINRIIFFWITKIRWLLKNLFSFSNSCRLFLGANIILKNMLPNILSLFFPHCKRSISTS